MALFFAWVQGAQFYSDLHEAAVALLPPGAGKATDPDLFRALPARSSTCTPLLDVLVEARTFVKDPASLERCRRGSGRSLRQRRQQGRSGSKQNSAIPAAQHSHVEAVSLVGLPGEQVAAWNLPRAGARRRG